MPYKNPMNQRRAARRHYEENKAEYIARAKRHTEKANRELEEYLIGYLMGHPCVDCGESDPVVLDFDHAEGSQKEFSIGDAKKRGFSLKRVKEEVRKCDVRCANCHRRKTAKERGWYKTFIAAQGSPVVPAGLISQRVVGSSPAPATKMITIN